MAGLGDLTDLVDRLLEVVLGLGVFRRIEGEAADQLRLEGMRQFAGLGDVFGEILFEGHVGILRAVGLVEQLHLADGRGDRGDVEAVFVFEVADFLDLGHRELHDVLHALADVDVPQAVVLEAQGGQRRELLDGREVKSGLVGQRGEEDGGLRHGCSCTNKLVADRDRGMRLCAAARGKDSAERRQPKKSSGQAAWRRPARRTSA